MPAGSYVDEMTVLCCCSTPGASKSLSRRVTPLRRGETPMRNAQQL